MLVTVCWYHLRSGHSLAKSSSKKNLNQRNDFGNKPIQNQPFPFPSIKNQELRDTIYQHNRTLFFFRSLYDTISGTCHLAKRARTLEKNRTVISMSGQAFIQLNQSLWIYFFLDNDFNFFFTSIIDRHHYQNDY